MGNLILFCGLQLLSLDISFLILQTNQLVLWLYPPNEDDADIYPCTIGTHPHDGDVTELKVIYTVTTVL
jgi:hypothetical protein